MADLSIFRWRTGRKVGRTIYAQPGPDPSDDDVLIGILDTPRLAAEAVTAHNAARAARLSGPGATGLPDGAYEAADEAFENRGVTHLDGRDELEAALLAAAPLIRADAEAKLAAIKALCGEGAPAVAVDRIEAILRDEGAGHG